MGWRGGYDDHPSMGALPIDVISDILARLPVKCLLQSKSVCKPWYALISSSHFINLHIRFHSSNKFLVFATNDDHILYTVTDFDVTPTKKVSFFDGLKFTGIVGSCNGVLLCLCNDSSVSSFVVCLINPSTLKCRRVPYLHLPKNYLCVNYGFGYDHKTDDYKVVRVVNFVYGSEDASLFNAREVMVYSLRANSWKFIEEKISDYATLAPRNGALVKGHLLHWMFWCMSKREHRISSFDVCKEHWGEVPMPYFVESGEKLVRDGEEDIKLDVVDLGVLDGCLCLLTRNKHNHSSDIDVWVMKEYGIKDSWTKLFNVSDLDVTRSLKFAPITYSKDGKEILVRKGKELSLLWYNLKEKRARNVEILGYCGITTCVESLVAVDK